MTRYLLIGPDKAGHNLWSINALPAIRVGKKADDGKRRRARKSKLATP